MTITNTKIIFIFIINIIFYPIGYYLFVYSMNALTNNGNLPPVFLIGLNIIPFLGIGVILRFIYIEPQIKMIIKVVFVVFNILAFVILFFLLIN